MDSKKLHWQFWGKRAAYLLATTLILIAPALYNRYPLVYFDTGAYLERAVDLQAPFDRAIGYSLFIRICSLLISTWPVIIVQAILVNLLLYRLISVFFQQNRIARHAVSIITLTFCSGLAWYTAQLMPDVFTFITGLLLLLILLEPKLNRKGAIGYGILLVVAVLTHLSHWPIVMLTLMLLVVFRLMRAKFSDRVSKLKWLTLSVVILITFLLQSTFNALHHNGFRFSLVPNSFLTANIGEMGYLKLYLDENCPETSESLCEIKNHLPLESGGYLWSMVGPLQNHPGGWQEFEQDCKPVVHDFLTQPRYLKWFVFGSMKATVKQMFQVDLASGLHYKYGEGTPPYWPIQSHFKMELNEYMNSIQAKGDKLPLDFFRSMNYLALFLSLLVLGGAALSNRLDDRLLWLCVIVFSIYFFNAAITGILANVYDRLQCRVLPLIQLAAIIISLKLWGHPEHGAASN